MDNLTSVLADIRQAALECHRDPASVRLIAVSKTWPADHIRPVLEAGQLDLGENRVQEMQEKYPQLPGARWHLIGSLQTNKVKYIAPYVHMIHSVDSQRLMLEISRQAIRHGRIIPVLLQVNISQEPQKGGFEPSMLPDAIRFLDECPGICVHGLMGMASFTDDGSVVRREFTLLKTLLESIQPQRNASLQPDELCMGMSGDYRIAIACGATMVRIGSAIFGSRS